MSAPFPELEPSKRSYDFGEFAMSATQGYGGGGVRFLHGGDEPLGHNVALDYDDISAEELALIRAHYRGQASAHVSFLLPDIIWRGHPVGGILPVDGRWKYAGSLEEGHKKGNSYNVRVPLKYVGPEPPPT